MSINYGSPADMCPCPVVPVNEWLDRDGRVIETRPLEADSGDTDAEDFLARPDAVGWRVVCPDCGKVYATG